MIDDKKKSMAENARNRLLETARSLHVAVVAESEPHRVDQGQSPFIRKEGRFYIFSSHLSSHTRHILEGAPAQFLLIEDESASQNIWARVRLKFSAEISEIHRKDAGFDSICDDIRQAHGPVMDMIRNFTDFHLFSITPVSGVLVTGFAAAFDVKGPDFTLTAHLSSG